MKFIEILLLVSAYRLIYIEFTGVKSNKGTLNLERLLSTTETKDDTELIKELLTNQNKINGTVDLLLIGDPQKSYDVVDVVTSIFDILTSIVVYFKDLYLKNYNIQVNIFFSLVLRQTSCVIVEILGAKAKMGQNRPQMHMVLYFICSICFCFF